MANIFSVFSQKSCEPKNSFYAIKQFWFLVAVVFWLPNQIAFAADNVYAQHDRNSDQYRKDCTVCHADVLSDPKGNIKAHIAMFPYAPGEDNDAKCVFCHHSTELVRGLPQPFNSDKGSIRRPVDSALCTLCHGPGKPSTPSTDLTKWPAKTPKQFYQVDIGNIPTYDPSKNPDAGKALYETLCSGCHNTLAKSEVKGQPASEIQQEINENEGGMGPLKVLTPAQIEAIAKALAQ